jgi:signal transduction histidine kinase
MPIMTSEGGVRTFPFSKRILPAIAGCILFLLSFSAFAYHPKIDSLLKALENHRTLDTARVNLLEKTTFLLRFNDPEKAMRLAGEQLQLAQQLHYNYGIVYALNHIGTIYKIMGATDKAMQHYIRASQVNAAADSNVMKGVALAYNNMGLVYRESDQYERAGFYFSKALQIDLKMDYKKGIAREYGNMGNMYLSQEKLSSALEYIRKGYLLETEISNKVGMIESLNDLALVSYKMKDYAGASQYLQKAITLNDGLCSASDGFMLYTRSLINAATGKTKEAIADAELAYQSATTSNNSKLLERTALNAAELYAAAGDYKRASEYYPLYIGYLNKAKDEKQLMMLTDIQERYESNNKQKEIDQLEASNEKFGYYNQRLVTFRNWLVVAMLIMGILLMLFYQQYRAKLKVNKELMAKFAEVRRMNDELNIKNEVIEDKNQSIEDKITALKHQEKQLNQAQQIARLGSWEKDVKSNRVIWSQQLYYMLGFPSATGPVSLVKCLPIVYINDRRKVLDALKGLFRNNIGFDIEFRINGRFDTVRVIHLKAQMVEDNGNQKFSGTLQDITEQKETEKKLVWAKDQAESANRTKGLFLANMSHEIRTPMNGILGFTDLLMDSCRDELQREYLSQIKNSGDTLVVLLNDILDFNKIEHGKLTIEKVNYPIRQEIENWIAPYRLQAKEKNVQLELSIDPAIPEFIEGDPFRTRQLFVNYISNALKFTEQGMVCVQITCDMLRDDQLMLNFRICDSGIGVPPEKQSLIFELFTQADDSTTRRYGGTGLGLAINKQLSVLMGGDAGVSSPGSLSFTFGTPGSDFWFSIKAARGKAIPENKTFDTGDNKNMRFDVSPKILVAEDNPVNQMLMKKVLDNMNCKVVVVDNGRAVIELLEKENFDIVLLDIQMPVMDGYQATEIIRNSSTWKEIPIVGVSANVFREDIEKSLAIGMNAHIGKPFKAKELYNILSYLIPRTLIHS